MRQPLTNNPPIPPRPPAVAKYLEHRFRPAITKGSGGTGRLIFALDTTASRQLTWDTAYALQNTMFDAVAGLGGLFAQLVYSRGYDECEASKWLFRAAELHRVMRAMSWARSGLRLPRRQRPDRRGSIQANCRPLRGAYFAVRSRRHSSAQGIARGILRSLRSAAIGRSKRSPQKGWRDPAPQPPARATLNVPRQASALLAERRSRQGPRLPDPP